MKIDQKIRKKLIAQIPVIVETSEYLSFDYDKFIDCRYVSILLEYEFPESLLMDSLGLSGSELQEAKNGVLILTSSQKEHVFYLTSTVKKAKKVFSTLNLFWKWIYESDFMFGDEKLLELFSSSTSVLIVYTRLMAMKNILKNER